MKNVLLLLVFLEFGILSLRAQTGYEVHGNIVGLPNGELSLLSVCGRNSEILGKTQAIDGKFSFVGKIDGVKWVYIVDKSQRPLASFMLENTRFDVASGGVVMGGGNAQKLLVRFNALDEELSIYRRTVIEKYSEARLNKKEKQQLGTQFQKIVKDLQNKEFMLLQENGDSYVAAYIVASTMEGLALTQLEKRYNLLGNNARTTDFGVLIEKRIEKLKQLEIDAIVPNFTLPAEDGGDLSLYTTKARLKMIYFWSSENTLSRQRNVELLQLYQYYNPRGLEIISISLDKNRQAWLRAVGEDGMSDWQNCCDLLGESSPVIEDYCINQLPFMILVDGDNRVINKNLWGSDLRKRIEELLKK